MKWLARALELLALALAGLAGWIIYIDIIKTVGR